jgi:hypothetical protein
MTIVHWFARAASSAAAATFFACASVIDGPYGGSFGPAAGLTGVSVCVLTDLLLHETPACYRD